MNHKKAYDDMLEAQETRFRLMREMVEETKRHQALLDASLRGGQSKEDDDLQKAIALSLQEASDGHKTYVPESEEELRYILGENQGTRSRMKRQRELNDDEELELEQAMALSRELVTGSPERRPMSIAETMERLAAWEEQPGSSTSCKLQLGSPEEILAKLTNANTLSNGVPQTPRRDSAQSVDEEPINSDKVMNCKLLDLLDECKILLTIQNRLFFEIQTARTLNEPHSAQVNAAVTSSFALIDKMDNVVLGDKLSSLIPPVESPAAKTNGNVNGVLKTAHPVDWSGSESSPTSKRPRKRARISDDLDVRVFDISGNTEDHHNVRHDEFLTTDIDRTNRRIEKARRIPKLVSFVSQTEETRQKWRREKEDFSYWFEHEATMADKNRIGHIITCLVEPETARFVMAGYEEARLNLFFPRKILLNPLPEHIVGALTEYKTTPAKRVEWVRACERFQKYFEAKRVAQVGGIDLTSEVREEARLMGEDWKLVEIVIDLVEDAYLCDPKNVHSSKTVEVGEACCYGV